MSRFSGVNSARQCVEFFHRFRGPTLTLTCGCMITATSTSMSAPPMAIIDGIQDLFFPILIKLHEPSVVARLFHCANNNH